MTLVTLKNARNLARTKKSSKNKIMFLKEMSDSNRCCGFGGVTMQTENMILQKQLVLQKQQ